MANIDNPTISINVTCVYCGRKIYMDVKYDDFERYAKGEGLIQNIFPYLSNEDREALISKTCSVCWEAIFPSDPELHD